MRKRLRYATIFIVIIVILGLTPFLMGLLYKAAYLKLLRADQSEKIQVVQYDNGWFSSDVKIQFKVKSTTTPTGADGNESIDLPTTFILVQHITHGPYLKNSANGQWQFAKAALETQIHLDPKIENKLLGARAEQGVMHINTLVSFANNYLSQIQTPVFTLMLDNDVKLSWLGLSGTVSTDVAGSQVQHVVIDLKNGPFNMHSKNAAVSVAASTITNDVVCSVNTICTGTQNIFFPEITASNALGEVTKLSNLSMTFDGNENDNDYSNSYQIAAKNMSMPKFSAGPVKFKFAYNNLNAEEIINLSTKMRADRNDATDLSSRRMMLASELNSNLAKLITAKTTVTSDLNLVTPNGNLTATARLFWPLHTPLPLTTQDIQAKINMHVDVRAAMTLVDQFIASMDDKPKGQATIAPPPPKIDYESALPTLLEFKNQLDAMLEKKLISAPIQAHILDMQAAQQAPTQVSAYIDSLVQGKQVNATTAYALKTAYSIFFMGAQRGILIAVFSDPATTTKALADKVSALEKMNVFTAQTGSELIELQNQSLSPEIYAVALHKFVVNNLISEDVESQLKAQYAAINKDLSLDADKSAPGVQAFPGSSSGLATPAQPVGKYQMQLDDMKRHGYVVQDKNDYVISIIYEKGVFKINGVNLN